MMKKRIFSILLSGVMVLSMMPAAAFAATGFQDVKKGEYYAVPVEWAVEKKITSGTGDGMFSPNKTCTRAEILTFLWKAAGSPAPRTNHNFFADVNETDYYYKAANWALENGVVHIKGVNLEPNTPCTRGATVEYIWNYAKCPSAATVSFTDVNSSTDTGKAVSWAARYGVTGGTGNGTFSPNKTCTRGDIATFLYRYFVAPIEFKEPVSKPAAPQPSGMKLDPLPPREITKQPDWYMSLTQPSTMSNARLVAEYQQITKVTSDDSMRTESVLVRESNLLMELTNRGRKVKRYRNAKDAGFNLSYYEGAYQEVLSHGDITPLEPYI